MKKRYINIFLLILLISIFIFLGTFYIHPFSTDKETLSVNVINTIEKASIDDSLIKSDSLDEIIQKQNPSNQTLPETASVNVPWINQNPELPTGCEITALTEVLNYYGFDIDKETLAANYLPMLHELTSGAYINYFYGSPWSDNGSGCFSPAIINTANSFLSDSNSDLHAYKLSYSDVDVLLNEVAKGYPVIVWTSFDYDSKPVTYREIHISNSEKFYWPDKEHCTVLSGYDLTNNTVTLTDPTYGNVTRSMEDFIYFYQMYFYQAVVIK